MFSNTIHQIYFAKKNAFYYKFYILKLDLYFFVIIKKKVIDFLRDFKNLKKSKRFTNKYRH